MRRWKRIPIVWQFQAVGWIVFEFLSYPFVMLDGPQAAFTAILLRDSVGFALTCAMESVYQRTYREGMSLSGAVILVLAVSLVVGSMLTMLSLAPGQTMTLEEQGIFGRTATFEMFLFWVSLAASWSLLYFSIKLLRDAGDRAVRVEAREPPRSRTGCFMLYKIIKERFRHGIRENPDGYQLARRTTSF